MKTKRLFEPDYCPLCGACEFEAGEGTATDEFVVKQEHEIRALYARLLKLIGEAQ